MIYYFNPGHETAILNSSPYYTPPANTVSMQQDLSFLPAWYACEGYVLVEDEIDVSFVEFLQKNLNFQIQPILAQDLLNYANDKIELWGISPQTIHSINELNNKYESSVIPPKWDEKHTYLCGRRASKDCLGELIKLIPEIDSDTIPQFYTSLDKVEIAVNKSQPQLLAKAPYSSSGKGLLRLPQSGLTRTERQILQGILNKQGELSLEILQRRVTDFAMEFMPNKVGEYRFVGYSLFQTNVKGAYLGNIINSQVNIEKEISKEIDIHLLERVKYQLETYLSETYSPHYNGCIGVDMMIYEKDSQLKLHPCVEINMRYNMGYLSYCFSQKYLAEGSKGHYYIDFGQSGETYQKHIEMQSKYPAHFENNKLQKGYLPLCPINKNSKYRAYILIE